MGKAALRAGFLFFGGFSLKGLVFPAAFEIVPFKDVKNSRSVLNYSNRGDALNKITVQIMIESLIIIAAGERNMRKKISIIILQVLVVGLFCSAAPVYSQHQNAIESGIDKELILTKVVFADGWDVPKVNSNELFKEEITNFQDISVISKGYKLEKTFDLAFDSFRLTEDHTLKMYSTVIEVTTVGTYSFNGNIFAYALLGSPFGFTQKGARVGIGVLYRVFYFDEDGDGKFETRYNALSIPRYVPAWVIK